MVDRVCHVFFSSRRRHTRLQGDWSSDVCSSDLYQKGGTPIRLLGQMSAARSSLAPQVPTFKEQGIDIELASLRGLAAPKGLPEGVRKKLVDRKSTRLNSSHLVISYAVFCLKKKHEEP